MWEILVEKTTFGKPAIAMLVQYRPNCNSKSFPEDTATTIETIERYPNLSKVALAMLSIFHGPRVESSFSMMGNILDEKSGRMSLQTYSAIQTVKYSMADNKASSHSCKSIALFKRDDIRTSPLMPLLSDNMRSARHRYRKQLEEKKSDKKDGRVTKKSLKKKNYKENESVKVKLLQKAYKPSLANVSVLESQEIAQEIVVANNSVMETSISDESSAEPSLAGPSTSSSSVAVAEVRPVKRMRMKQTDLMHFIKKKKLAS